MSQGKSKECEKCCRRLNDFGVCPNCGWSYAKEYEGQQELFVRTEQEKK